MFCFWFGEDTSSRHWWRLKCWPLLLPTPPCSPTSLPPLPPPLSPLPFFSLVDHRLTCASPAPACQYSVSKTSTCVPRTWLVINIAGAVVFTVTWRTGGAALFTGGSNLTAAGLLCWATTHSEICDSREVTCRLLWEAISHCRLLYTLCCSVCYTNSQHILCKGFVL